MESVKPLRGIESWFTSVVTFLSRFLKDIVHVVCHNHLGFIVLRIRDELGNYAFYP